VSVVLPRVLLVLLLVLLLELVLESVLESVLVLVLAPLKCHSCAIDCRRMSRPKLTSGPAWEVVPAVAGWAWRSAEETLALRW